MVAVVRSLLLLMLLGGVPGRGAELQVIVRNAAAVPQADAPVTLGPGFPFPHLTAEPQGKAPDAGALELGDELCGDKAKFPQIPKWPLDEWPLSSRGR